MRRLLILLLVLSSLAGNADEKKAIYVFDQQQMEMLNVVTLDELLQYMPFIRVHYRGDQDHAQMGNLNLSVSTVYLDGMPLFMDNVQHHHYTDISLMGIERVELRVAGEDRRTKFLGPFTIHLISKPIDDRPASAGFDGMLNSRTDAVFTARGTSSTARHSFGLGFQRYFSNASPLGERSYALPVRNSNAVGVQYHRRFYAGSSLSLQYRMNNNESILRGPIFPNTARAEDLFSERLDHRLNTGLNIRLSKTHRLEVRSVHIRSDLRRNFFDVDLSNGRREARPIRSITDSSGNGYSHVAAWLSREDSSKRVNFALGIEYSRQRDVKFSSIEAIPISYVDYGIIPSFSYIEEDLEMSGSLRFLSHSLLGNAIMPRFHIHYQPGAWRVRMDFIQSVFYPYNSQLFYLQELSNFPVNNNLELEMGRMQHVNLQLQWVRANSVWTLGSSVLNLNSLVRTDLESGSFTSDGTESGLFHYIAHTGSYGNLEVQALLGLSGGSDRPELLIENDLHAEGNFLLRYGFDKDRMHVTTAYRYMGPSAYISQGYWQERTFMPGRLSTLTAAVSREVVPLRVWINAGITHALDPSQIGENYTSSDYRQAAFVHRGRSMFIRLRIDLS